MNTDGLINLCGGILAQAAKDYRKAAKRGRRGTLVALEKFFRSEWGQLLSRNQGEFIIENLRKEVNGNE